MEHVIRSGVQAMHAFSKNDIACNLILSDGFVTGERATTGTHFHAFFEVHYVISGTVHIILDDKDIPIDEGTICIIPPQVIHRIVEIEGSKRVGFRFSYAKRKCDQEEGYFDRFEKAFGSLSSAYMMKDTSIFKHCLTASRVALAERAPDYAVDELLFLAIDQLTYCICAPEEKKLPSIDTYSDSLVSEYIEDYLNMNFL